MKATLASLLQDESRRLSEAPAGGYHYLPIELIRTSRKHYVFDARNTCFIEVERVAFDILAILRERPATVNELASLLPQHTQEEIEDAYQDLLDAQTDNLLLPYNFERCPRYEDDEYEQVLSRRMGGFTIFITTRCNLGCSYCIYGGQYDQHKQLSQTPMPWETAKAAMDFLAEHSGESKEVRLDFFGGEPLLAFSMLKRCVYYLKSILSPTGPRVVITIASNGTIINERILDFLLEHDVYLQFSIDGGRDSHDRFRPIRGTTRGSYDIILQNLSHIHGRSPDYYRRRILIKGVLNTDTIDTDDAQFFEHPLIRMVLDEGHIQLLNLEPHYDLAKDSDYFQRIHRLSERLLAVHDAQTEEELLVDLNPKQRALYYHTLAFFFEAQAIRPVYFANRDAVPFTKGCLIGYGQGSVTANGYIFICHKSARGKNFVIGNVIEGQWYLQKIKQLNTLFFRDWHGCSSCFVQKFCDLCYEKLDGEVGKWVNGRTKFCEFNRQRYRVIFQYMLGVLENNPLLWAHVDRLIEIKLKEKTGSAGNNVNP